MPASSTTVLDQIARFLVLLSGAPAYWFTINASCDHASQLSKRLGIDGDDYKKLLIATNLARYKGNAFLLHPSRPLRHPPPLSPSPSPCRPHPFRHMLPSIVETSEPTGEPTRDDLMVVVVVVVARRHRRRCRHHCSLSRRCPSRHRRRHCRRLRCRHPSRAAAKLPPTSRCRAAATAAATALLPPRCHRRAVRRRRSAAAGSCRQRRAVALSPPPRRRRPLLRCRRCLSCRASAAALPPPLPPSPSCRRPRAVALPLPPRRRSLVGCCVVVRRPISSSHAVMRPSTLSLPAAFADKLSSTATATTVVELTVVHW